MRVIFMGTPEFAVPSLERLVESGYTPAAVVTGPDRPRGRGQAVSHTPVKEAALRLGVSTILQPESVREPAFAEEIAELAPDVIAVVAFRILPPEVFTLGARGAFNLHGSLLPAYRGAAPIQRALMAGETETGVTTFYLEKKVDTGGIILQRSISVGLNETAGEVHDRMKKLGADAVVETVRLIERGNVDVQRQDDRKATPAPKIFKRDARIPWAKPAKQVHNHIRGLSPYPGAWTRHGVTHLKIYRSRFVESSSAHDAAPGVVVTAGPELRVACGAQAVEVLEIQQQGRRRLGAAEFLNGYDLKDGDRLA